MGKQIERQTSDSICSQTHLTFHQMEQCTVLNRNITAYVPAALCVCVCALKLRALDDDVMANDEIPKSVTLVKMCVCVCVCVGVCIHICLSVCGHCLSDLTVWMST